MELQPKLNGPPKERWPFNSPRYPNSKGGDDKVKTLENKDAYVLPEIFELGDAAILTEGQSNDQVEFDGDTYMSGWTS